MKDYDERSRTAWNETVTVTYAKRKINCKNGLTFK